FQKKIANLYFLDPACGCGNFLIITYRELRDLEILVLQELNKTGQLVTDISAIIQVNVNQFAGIEYDEFAVRVAEVAMWLIDHQMNVKVSNTFGQYFVRLPLKKAAKIVNGNALRIDWEEIISKENLNFILGNPPFVGAMIMNDEQRNDMAYVFDGEKGIGVLDYVCAWYIKTAQIIQGNRIRVAFVSTNSISQGEQVALLWNILFQKYQLKIHFAHRTFKWSNEAKGNAAVHCVIIGFASFNITNKILFDYEDIQGESLVVQSNNINPYLVDGSDIIINNRSFPLSNVPLMRFGSMPRDGGNFIFTEPEKEEFLKLEPKAEKLIKPYTGAQEFINGYSRYCLWLVDISPRELKTLPEVIKKVDKVKNFRLKSKAASTRKFAATPTLFCQIAQPETNYLLVPRVSSERRKYIPIGFMNKNVIGNDQVLLIPNANLYLFGILTSEMHMAWVKYVCGRLKSDYRYSKDIVYNNYPFPETATDKQKQTVETCAQAVLDTRVKYPDSSLADLYDPLTMPPDLLKAHQKLDKAVDLCYRPQPFTSELNRIEYLFELYEKLTALLLPTSKQKLAKRKNPQ
ncbi:MAG: class I SAM-dependent DNA methyltransferase, partial [Microcystis aeruginosa W13-11]|nr:class I SAM-dependent DNA methyltransferase [Microcystis aeruginosa W13-11]